ncbi:ABC transporter B family member 26, chloroplastic-like isoform X1 [Glycine soja]|uniref:ABC transporter B family member 26, chloroplastic isoform A n=1 Tax=Glycine soja TaxID=3848 RepID=A0A445LXY1_GLYSO|nr:ABC transporter B family member 26, chloroplastic-like isoform X1 [Glycine soja]RZC28161.1 ABC transporter B family member 26, chloroplastic isoform A [Glycine soja]
MPLLLSRTPPSSFPLTPLRNARAPLITPSQKRFTLAATRIVLFTSRRRILASPPPPPKCASINGISVPNNPEASGEQQVYSASGLLDRIRKWVGFLPSILPGGRWWEFSGDVDVQVVAQPVTVWRALGKMWDLVARDRWVIFAAFSALIVAAVSEISIPHFLTASIFSAQSADLAVFHRNVRLLVLLCVASGICSGIRGCFFGIANMILVKRMRETLYSSLLLQDISFFDNETVGDLTSRLGADCQQVSRVIGNDLNLIMRNVLQGGGSLIYLLILSWPLGLSTLVVCSILAAVMLRYGRYQKKAARLIQEVTASANDVAQETFSLIRTVRVYGTEEEEHGRYKWWLEKLADISLRQSAAYGVWNFSFNILYHSTQVIAVLFGGMSILAGHITAEKLTKFILYSEWLIYSTWWVGDNISNLMQSVGASEKVFHLMDLLPSSQFIERGVKLQRLTGCIEFLNVSFHYPSRPMASVVQHVNFVVHPGEVVAIVGLSGSGKSTLVNLLLRLYEPTNGQILIDDIPLKDLDIMWWRERIGFVGQEPKLFRMDISSNIRYGCTQDVKQKDIEWAAKQAYAHNFISALPNGYETLVDDDLLSGGQKQRIAIARALLRDPKILILDEATSALDAESEHNVKGVLRSVRSDSATRSVIVIAHRLSTIQAADRIVVMDGGEIVEMGSHRELLLKDGLYARLTRKQADAMA